MKNRNEIVETIYERIIRNEIFYLVVGCALVLMLEWLEKRVFLNR